MGKKRRDRKKVKAQEWEYVDLNASNTGAAKTDASTMNVDTTTTDSTMQTAAILAEQEEDAQLKRPDTRGRTLQRHKREYRKMRLEIKKLRQESLRWSKKTDEGKARKKAISFEIKKMQSDLEERHRRELAVFERIVDEEEAVAPEVLARHWQQRHRRRRRRRSRRQGEDEEDNELFGGADVRDITEQLERTMAPQMDKTKLQFNFGVPSTEAHLFDDSDYGVITNKKNKNNKNNDRNEDENKME